MIIPELIIPTPEPEYIAYGSPATSSITNKAPKEIQNNVKSLLRQINALHGYYETWVNGSIFNLDEYTYLDGTYYKSLENNNITNPVNGLTWEVIDSSLLVTSPVNLVTKTSDVGAVAIPSGTTAERPETPLVGYLRLNTELNVLEVWNNGWLAVTGNADIDHEIPIISYVLLSSIIRKVYIEPETQTKLVGSVFPLLTDLSYLIGEDVLDIYADGIRLLNSIDYIENSTTSLSLSNTGSLNTIECIIYPSTGNRVLSYFNIDVDLAIGAEVTLPNSTSYTIGTNSLLVFVDGILMDITSDYSEVSTTSVSFTNSLTVGQVITFIVYTSNVERTIITVDTDDITDVNLLTPLSYQEGLYYSDVYIDGIKQSPILNYKEETSSLLIFKSSLKINQTITIIKTN